MSKSIPTIDHKTDITVSLGVILDGDKMLVAKRPESSEQGGLLEFPGGKLAPGENIYDALTREIKEETGIKVLYASPLIEFVWRYANRSIHFYVFEVNSWGAEKIKEQWHWVKTGSLNDADFPPANRCIINALKLPPCYLITPQLESTTTDFIADFERSLSRGIKLALLRDYRIDDEEYCRILKEMKSVAGPAGAQILSHNRVSAVEAYGVDGVHFNAEHLIQCKQRPVAKDVLFSASCHNQEELEHAVHISADFVTLSPILKSASHPNEPAIGWPKFYDLIEGLPLPIYALGGMDYSDYKYARTYGAQGVAGIRGLWSNQ